MYLPLRAVGKFEKFWAKIRIPIFSKGKFFLPFGKNIGG
jgi:hypothetical protein